MICNNCGHEIIEGSLFCGYCGNCITTADHDRENNESLSSLSENMYFSQNISDDEDNNYAIDYDNIDDDNSDDEDIDDNEDEKDEDEGYIILSKYNHEKVIVEELFLAIERFNPIDLSRNNIDNTITVLKGIDFAVCSQSFYSNYPTSKLYIKKRIRIPKKPAPKRIEDNREEYENKLKAVEQKPRWKDIMAWVKDSIERIGFICLATFFVVLFLACVLGDYFEGFRFFIVFVCVAWIVGVGCGCFISFKRDRALQAIGFKNKIVEIEGKTVLAQKENKKQEEEYRKEIALIPQKKKELEKKYKKLGEKYYDLELANRILELAARERILASKYHSVAAQLCKFIEDGRADTIKEAINLLVNEQHRDMVESVQEWHNRLMEIEQRNQNEAILYAQEEAARKLVDEARKQTEAVQRAARAQEEVARTQEKVIRAQERRAVDKEKANRGSSAQCLACINQIGCQYKGNPPKNCGAFRSKY